ncbi:MAG: sulfite exporter TauE/SafE family protein [Mariprofundales bacterium]|nr:sulfite exporter TauE/SafE family protein [Mariprofundales bacterium]
MVEGQDCMMMGMEWWLLLLLLGAVVGVLAGLFGIGGGTVLVPSLVLLFGARGLPDEVVFPLALGTAMASIVFTAVASAWSHHRLGDVRWSLWRRMALGVVIGTWLGTVLVPHLGSTALALFFVGFIALLAWKMWIPASSESAVITPTPVLLHGVGTGIGLVSALVSIGGGAMTVPFLLRCQVPLKDAIGTSAAVGVLIAMVGSLGYLAGGTSPDTSLLVVGTIYLPGVAAIALGSVATAPFGAHWSHRLPATQLRRAFALLLLVLSLSMLWQVVL